MLFNAHLITLSYHAFNDEPSTYEFSRTYEQFAKDLDSVFDLITFDDGYISQIKACEMMRERNIRAKVGIITSMVGKQNYMNWSQIREIAKYHDIENHSSVHVRLPEYPFEEIVANIYKASKDIEKNTGKLPRYFIPPFNQCNADVERAAKECWLQVIKNRITITKNTVL